MKNIKLQICDVTIHPGEETNLALPMPEQYSCAPMYMPIRIMHGKTKGPCVLIFSTLNGNELNGIEIVNNLMKDMSADKISGTIIAIPVVNVYGLTHFPKRLPSGNLLSQCFPGKPDGNYGERLADVFTQELLKKADYCIELQTGDLNHNILPQVYCDFDNKETRKLAMVFGAPVVTDVTVEGNSLRQTTENLGIPLIVYQGGEAMRLDENAIAVGTAGIKNIMQHINCLPGQPERRIEPTFSQEESWIISHTGGILHTDTNLGQIIKEGEKLGSLSDPFGTGDKATVRSPHDGIIVGINTTPLIHEGLPLFKVASFIDDKRAETAIGKWNDQQDDDFLS
jgi:hypothetical protein